MAPPHGQRADVSRAAPDAPAAHEPAEEVPPPPPPPAPPADVWQIQAGAFRGPGAAEGHAAELQAALPELRRLSPAYERRDGLTRLRFGVVSGRAAADGYCTMMISAGYDCYVVPRD